jgi:hypothetical protein
VVGFGGDRRGFVDVGAIGEIFGVYRQVLTEGVPARMVLQELIETEASDVIGAARYERTDSRVNERNGSRPRILATQAGDIDLRIPKLPGAVRGGDGGLRRRRVHPRCR